MARIWQKAGGGVSLRCNVPPFVLWVTNQHIDRPGVWLGSCSGLFDNKTLDTVGGVEFAQDAQEELMNAVIWELKDAAKAMAKIRPLKVGE